MQYATRKTNVRLEDKGKKVKLDRVTLKVSVTSKSGQTFDSEWVSVGAKGDKHEVKRYCGELRELCRPLAAVDGNSNQPIFVECGTAEFVATVAEQSLKDLAAKEKAKAKKKGNEKLVQEKAVEKVPEKAAPTLEKKSKKGKDKAAAPVAAPAAASAEGAVVDLPAFFSNVRGMMKAVKKAAPKLSGPELTTYVAKLESVSKEMTDAIAVQLAHKKKKKKKKKVPRFSPFLLFCKDARPKLAKKHKDKSLSVPDTAREMGKQWNALSDTLKKPYVELAATLKAAAIEARANAPESESEDEDVGEKKRKRTKHKTPRYSGFLLFCKDTRPGFADRKMAVPDQARELGIQWGALDKKKKQEYLDTAEQMKKEWLASPAAMAPVADSDLSEQGPESKKRKKQTRAKRPRFSAFLLFCKAERPKLPESMKGKVTEQAAEMGRLWKAINPKKKEKLEAEAQRQKAAFLAAEVTEAAVAVKHAVPPGNLDYGDDFSPGASPVKATPAKNASGTTGVKTPAMINPSTGKRKRRTKAEMAEAKAAEARAKGSLAAVVPTPVAAPAPAATSTPGTKEKRKRRTKKEMEEARARGEAPAKKASAVKPAVVAASDSDSSDSDSDSDDIPIASLK